MSDPMTPDQRLEVDPAIVERLLRGTVQATGQEFFRALVRNLADVLGVDGAWITEYLVSENKLRALAFWMKGSFVEQYEHLIPGTPCEPVIRDRCLVHFPDRLLELFPDEPDVRQAGAVSYIGVPLLDTDGSVMGHLAAMDGRPMPPVKGLAPILELFAARGAAEVRRLRAEQAVRESEELLAGVLNAAFEAIVVIDECGRICRANPAATRLMNREELKGLPIGTVMSLDSARHVVKALSEINGPAGSGGSLWIPALLESAGATAAGFKAEATLARFQTREGTRYTLILRDVRDRMVAERRIEELSQEAEYLRETTRSSTKSWLAVGGSSAMAQVADRIDKVAATDTTVLILGETGSGKELAARTIHESSRRHARPMVRVNCGAIPESLIESELFGHEKGSFTGATQRREGRFAMADGSTIFLDEIGELPLEMQVKLLRVLQEGEFDPVGSSQTVRVDVRILAATHRDLKRMVAEGTFREDLYYRLSVFPLALPPLRARGDDVVHLAAEFAGRFAAQMGRHVAPLSESDLRALRSYHWPGNVRELQNVIERAIILSGDGRVNLGEAMPLASRDVVLPTARELKGLSSDSVMTDQEMRELERANIRRALEACDWRISGAGGAAERLGLPASTLASRMKALGIARK